MMNYLSCKKPIYWALRAHVKPSSCMEHNLHTACKLQHRASHNGFLRNITGDSLQRSATARLMQSPYANTHSHAMLQT